MLVFRPSGLTATLSVTATSSRVPITVPPQAEYEVRLVNLGTVPIFLACGGSTVTTTTADGMPMLPNTVEVFRLSADQTHIAAITGTGSSTLEATPGAGQ